MALQLGPRHAPPGHGRPRRGIVAGLVALIAILAVVAGLPWALLTFTNWPVTGVPSWQQVRDLPATAATDEAIVAVFVVGVWLAWFVFTASVLVEAVAQVRGRDVVRLPAVGSLQVAARNLVATVVLALGSLGSSSVNASRPVIPAAALSSRLALPPALPTASSALAATEPSVEVEWRSVLVGEGDTAWGLATIYYGDGAAAHQLWLDNRGAVQPGGVSWASEGDPIEPGWVLRVRPETAEPAPTEASPSPDPVPDVVTIEPGDNLWAIAEEGLAARVGHDPADPETAPFWQATVDLNADALRSGDPDLVYPGEHIRLPATPSAPAVPAAPERPPAPPSPPPPPSLPEPPEPSAPPTDTTSTAPASAATSTPATSGSGPSDTSSSPPTGESDNEDDPQATSVGIAVSTGLAALVLAALARRRLARRRGIRPGTATGARTAGDIAAEQAVAAAADDTWRTMRRVVDAVAAAHRSSSDSPVAVTAVVVHPGSGDATVHLTEPAPPVVPFLAGPDPDTWRLPAQAGESPAGDDDQPVPVLETLVTLGQTHAGDWVFVDLESLGAVSIEGHADHATQLVRSLVAELALQPVDHYVDVTVTGELDGPAVAEQGIVIADTLDDTIARTHEQHAHDTGRWINDEGYATTPAARAHGLPRDGLVVSVLVAGSDADQVLVGRLAEAAAPGGKGLAVVSLTPLDPPATQIVLAEDGTIDVPHVGLTVQSASLTTEDLRRVDQLLGNEPTTVTETTSDDEPAAMAIPAAAASTYAEPKWDYCVRIFADTVVCTPDGEAVSFRYGDNPVVTHKNTNRGSELLAYLALRPERSTTRDEVREHLWWGRSISTRSVDTLFGGTRKVLGGGDHYLSTAQGDPGQRRYHLAPTIVTDLELLDHALAYARTANDPDAALDALRPALERIERPPFRQGHMGGGLAEWATAHRITDRAEHTVVDAALLAAELLHPQGPAGITQAQHLVERALRACQTNEALIRAAMQLDAHQGHHEAAHARYDGLVARLQRDDLEPEADTTALRAKITKPSYRIG